MQFISGSVTKAKEDAQYDSVDATLKTTLEAKLTAAADFLTEDSKLKNLDASSNLDTTKASLESAKTALDAAIAAVKPDLDFQKTKTSAAAKVTELDALVNPALKTELQRQVDALTKDHATEATTMLANLTSLKDSLTSLQDLVSKGLAMQVDYPRNYYDADNKADFDAALLKASSVFPVFQWTAQSIMVPAPEEGALPNPRAWTKAREKSEFKLQNFVIAPAQAAHATQSDLGAAAAASATVRLATGIEETETEEAAEAETQPAAPTPAADLASTVSYLKSLNDTLKAATDALNGDNSTTKTAYYKADAGRTLYWDGFIPKIVVQGYQADGAGNGKATHEAANRPLLQQWFETPANWEKLSEQLTKKLGSDKFKNVVLTAPTVSYEDGGSNTRIPKVTFTLQGKDGYILQTDNGATSSLTLSIRVLYTSASSTQNALRYQGASSSAAPSGANTADHAKTIKDVNVYLNYTGPAIVLDATLPVVGKVDNTTTNGTSNVTDDLNTKFKDLVTSDQRTASLFFQAIQKYVNTFDPKYPANSISDQKNGVTWARVENKALKIANLNNPNAVFVQQMKDDSEAVYLPVIGVANNRWLNTFLIRIPLTKFVKPLTVFTATPTWAPTQDSSASNTSPQTTTQNL
ncbi:hypothetical protein [Mycoplasmopsis synoviae]|uniref:hypothetical protein n=1 Tax=Mycoplasmopsis synoviae TaxID=2109 RepID=UPI001EF81434|nr:hypothetical protein [Mycoplasmopsis synoviae]ULL02625.1 hypothetical protein JM201_01135 [Mycoplasmopsis synoviae]